MPRKKAEPKVEPKVREPKVVKAKDIKPKEPEVWTPVLGQKYWHGDNLIAFTNLSPLLALKYERKNGVQTTESYEIPELVDGLIPAAKSEIYEILC